MFSWRKQRRRPKQFTEVKSQIVLIQTRLVLLVRRELAKQFDALTASQLAQATVDRLFARPAALSGEYSQLIESLSNTLARENKFVRDAAFLTLNAMLELEGANKDFKAERRIMEALHWLNQFGAQPMGMTLQEIHERLTTEDDLPQIVLH
jgi:hypothetical protein